MEGKSSQLDQGQKTYETVTENNSFKILF